MNGTIYFVQPAELVGTNRFKIGCSSKNDLKRCKNGYKKGTRFLIIMECAEPFVLEQELKKAFNTKFTLLAGKEYFQGNESDMQKTFLEVVSNAAQLPKPSVEETPLPIPAQLPQPPVEETPALIGKHRCTLCHYSCLHTGDWHKHLKSKKHERHLLQTQTQAANENNTLKDPAIVQNPYTCQKCGINYKTENGLRKHMNTNICLTKNDITGLLLNMVRESNELHKLIIDTVLKN